jgi:hypothetical protein
MNLSALKRRVAAATVQLAGAGGRGSITPQAVLHRGMLLSRDGSRYDTPRRP